jgi:small GTP-binding protein
MRTKDLMARRPASLDIKIVVLGSAFVGKTSLINRYCNNSFNEDTRSTIGAGFFTHTIMVDETEVTMMLWDTAGEERFRSVAPSLLRGANGLVLVFDLAERATFTDIDIYLDLFLDTCKVDPAQNAPVLLLGNKADVSTRATDPGEIEKWKKKNHVPLYWQVSAKTGENVQLAMDKFVETLVAPQQSQGPAPVHVLITPAKRKRNGGCCGK